MSERISHNDLSVILIYLDKKTNKVLIEERLGSQSFAGKKIYPGGHVEVDEADHLDVTVVRESAEEFGVVPKSFYFLNTGNDIVGETGKIIRAFVVTDWDGQIPQQSLDKGNRLEWVDLGDELNSELKSTRDLTEAVLLWLV